MTARVVDPEVVARARTWAAQQQGQPYRGADPAALARLVRQVDAFRQLPTWQRRAMGTRAYWWARRLRLRLLRPLS